MFLDDLIDLECPECCSNQIKWHCSQQNASGVADGRLRLNEVSTVFFAGCEECSATVRQISGDDLADLLTEE